MSAPQETVLRALESERINGACSLMRARAQFRGRSDYEMRQQYGQSGQTCAEVLTGCERRLREIDGAISWIKGGAS